MVRKYQLLPVKIRDDDTIFTHDVRFNYEQNTVKDEKI